MPLKKDTITPWIERTKRELEDFRRMTIRVGVQSSKDKFDAKGRRVEKPKGDKDDDEKISDATLLTIAFVQEFGAHIHPRHAKNLAIPLCKEADGKSPGDFQHLHPLVSAEGHVFLVREPGKGTPKKTYSEERDKYQSSAAPKRDYKHQDDTKEIEYMFLLLPSVHIPERSFLRAGFDTGKEELVKTYQRELGNIVSGQKTALEAAQAIGAFGVSMIQNFIDRGQFKAKSDITKETSVAANSPLKNRGVLYNSITYTIERKK